MGVPALFRWLSQKYPKIISPVIEDKPREFHGEVFPVDGTQPNPNGEEFDNLYLDMNGIVHPCSHPEDKPAPANEEEMMLEVFKYTDRVVNMVRPRKLLMIAVDGCAPRAKMNQQRSRRFRSAQDAKAKDKDNEDFMKMLKAQNNGVLPEGVAEQLTKKTWDSNSITPGTPFMDILAESLRYWCRYKLNTDPMWAKMEVVISDATVPGEGEHKIMEFIRSQRSSPEHNVNTRHVMYGLDADLIMLGLATHEPHFRILREDVFAQDSKPRACKICGQTGHRAEECRGEAKQKSGEFDEKAVIPDQKPFIWLHVSVLREYLAEEMRVPGVEFDLERAIDDWVFMCFFVGNDFLPHLPSLDIREEGIDTLIGIWREEMPLMGGWVTQDGRVNMQRAAIILEGLAKQEANIFKKRRAIEEKREQKEKRRNQQEEQRAANNKRQRSGKFNQDAAAPSMTGLDLVDINSMARKKHNLPGQNGDGSDLTYDKVVNRASIENANDANKSAAAVLRERLKNGQASASATSETQLPSSNGTDALGDESGASSGKKRKASDIDANDNGDEGTPGRDSPVPPAATQKDPELQEDTVKLWEEGYEGRYYEQKFGVAAEDIEFRHQVARDYVTGLQWVLLYYFQGCPSWTWFYPHHYAPFAHDFVGIGDLQLEYDLGKPFRPYEQLMGVMPAASKHTLPEAFHSLMTDADSEIKDFYPEDFYVDLNGKKFAWQGVAILPFIDEKRLMNAMATRYPLLSDDEKRRNEPGRDVLIFREGHPLHEIVMGSFYSKKQGAPKFKLDPRTSRELAGKIEKIDDFMPFDEVKFPGDEGAMPNLEEDHSMTVYYDYPTGGTHKSMLLRGVKLAPSALDDQDRAATRRAASTTSKSFGNTPLRDSFRGGRGGRGGFRGGHHGSGHNGQNNFDNPFASHLQHGPPPPFPVPGMNGQMPFPPNFPPPPHMFQQGGMPFPPPPPGMMPPNGQFPPNMPQFPFPPPQPGFNQYGNNHRGGHHGHRGRR